MLRIRVSTASAEIIENDLITAGRVGLECQFTFSSDWNDLAKTVVIHGCVKRDWSLVGNSMVIPGECLAREQYPLKIGVYGANAAGNIVIPTIWTNFGKIQPGAQPSGIDPDEITPDLVAQIEQNSANALYLAQQLTNRANAGEFNGQDGAPGRDGTDGQDGQDGQDGYSPEVTITSITGGHQVKITDEDHPTGQTFNVMDGQDATVDATLSNVGEAADAAETGKVKELAETVAERIYDYSNDIAAADITRLQGKTINSSNNLVDNASYSVLYLTAPADGRYKVVSSSNSQLVMRVYSSTNMGSSTFVKTGIPGYTDYTRYAELETGQVLAVRAKSTDFTITVSYATTYSVEMRQSLPLTETMEAQVKTWLNFPDELEMPLSVCHRGLATVDKVGNTMPAFEDAVEKGWKYLETDIRFTSDSVCVLLHDSTIATGVNIADITYTQALTYDLGGGTHIATLEELLELCRKSHTHPVIEVKDTLNLTTEKANIVWALVEKYEMKDEVFFLCSSSGGVTPFMTKNPYVPTVRTNTTEWTVIDPSEFGDHSPSSDAKKWSSGKNKVFFEKEKSAFADVAAQENFIDWCHYWGCYAGIYCPTTQAALDALSKRFDMVTSQYYKYEIERSYSGGGGSSVEPYTSNPAALGTASPGSSDKYARGDHVHKMPSAADVGAVAVAQGVAHAREFCVVGSDGNITTMTLATWQGGNYGS